MEKATLESLLAREFSTRQIAEELSVSQTKVRYWLKHYKLSAVGKPFLKFSDNDIRTAVEDSTSFADVCRKLGASPAGSSHQHFKRRVVQLQLDTSHFAPWAGNKERSEFRLVHNPKLRFRVRGERLRAALEELKRPYQCSVCSISDWQGKPLQLHVDHIDGNWKNNEASNLRYLCLNCHSQTATWCRKVRE